MKKAFSILMVLVLMFSLSITAFAAEGKGSITITNATIDQEYAPYKIFDASISGGSEGGFTYSIAKDNQFFDDIFGTEGAADFNTNPYFEYHEDGSVVKRAGVADADVLAYLKSLVYEADGTVKSGLTPAATPVTATSKEVKFENLDYGYYMITSSLGTTVTVNSTDPDVVVIDKNQKPGDGFEKLVYDEDTGNWVTSSSANIGDMVDFKVDFHATNYNGEKQVKYYVISDIKGDALWVEFNTIEVEVNGTDLVRGYYYATPGIHKTDEWEYLGTWTEGEKADINNAQWFLIHKGYDAFDIVIPWMDDFEFTGTDSGFELDFGTDAKHIYDSSSKVVLEYEASVEPGADIDGTKKNLFNRADLSWMDDVLVTPPGESETTLTVHAMGVTKTDGATNDLLAGAAFELYTDETCTAPVYVIPTDVKGVYIIDDLNTVLSGAHRESSRKTYAAYLDAYLKDQDGNTVTQKNEVVTQANGKLVVLGLEAGTYYLKETKAPDGYNKLATAIAVEVPNATSTESFTFHIDGEGNIVTSGGARTETYGKVVNVPVTNNKGTELPSTGGTGTMMLITIGTMIAMAFAVLLITQKKMSTYHD